MPEIASAKERLRSATDFARESLATYTHDASIGSLVGDVVETDNLVSFLFECLLPGYPGWHWVITLATLPDSERITIVEVELVAGEKALVAPRWVPWSERQAISQPEASVHELEDEIGETIDPEEDLVFSDEAENEGGVSDEELAGIDDIDEDDIAADELDVIDEDADDLPAAVSPAS